MFDVFMEWLSKVFKSRLLPVAIVYGLLAFLIINRLFTLQVVKGEEYASKSEKKSSKTLDIKATRADILDRKGKVLATNELSYTVIVEDNGALTKSADKNAMIMRLIRTIEKNGDTIVNDFPIIIDEHGEFKFNVDEKYVLRFKKDVYSAKNVDSLSKEQKDATAEEVFKYLRYETNPDSPKFNITDEYTDEEALQILNIRFSLFMNRYAKYLPITVATNVNDKTVAAIKEYGASLPGVDILQESHRVYTEKYSESMAHILGYTGLVSQEDIENDKKEYYSATDQIGKTGIEKEYEDYLRGTKGVEKVILNSNSTVASVVNRVEPKAGDDVVLTIDADLQKACYDILEKKIASILVSNIRPGLDYGSKGTSGENIRIPIYEVYNALIYNNVIDINVLNEEDSTDLERSVYAKFDENRESTLKNITNTLKSNTGVKLSALSKDMQEYVSYVLDILNTNNVFIKENVDKEDKMYVDYHADKISLNEYLQYAISQKWVDLSVLEIDESFYSTEELYSELIEFAIKKLKNDNSFNKMIYRSLIFSNKLSGREICLLLFDQGVLKYNENDVNSLKNGTVSSYDFIIKKIKKREITPAQLALEPCSGSVMVVDPKTGDVLAAVTYPGYDNNKMANTVDPKYYSKLAIDNSYPLIFRPTQSMCAPGSTYKMLVTVAGLEENVISPYTKIKDLGVFDKLTNPPKCWLYPRGTHGSIDVTDALRHSCNYFFYEVGFLLGRDSTGKYNSEKGLSTIKKYAELFGFNDKSGLEVYENESKISDTDSVRSAIGQGSNSFTPALISRYITTIANKGTCYDLTLIDKVVDVNNKTVVDNKAKVRNELNFKNSTWNAVFEGMYKVANAEGGSVYNLYKDLDLEVAGKTGTAQESKNSPNHSLFTSFAPYNDPKITVTAVIRNGYTSGNAAELAKDIYKYYFKLTDAKELTDGEVDAPEASATNVSD